MRALFPTCSILTPVTGDPYPATGPAHPVAFHPYTPRIWARNPAAGDPFIACSGPTPVAVRPNIPRSGRNCLCFDPNRRRSLSHKNLSRDRPRDRAGRGDFLRRCSCCHRRRWFRSAAGQQNRCQGGYVKTRPHKSPCHGFVLHDRVGFVLTGDNDLSLRTIEAAGSCAHSLPRGEMAGGA